MRGFFKAAVAFLTFSFVAHPSSSTSELEEGKRLISTREDHQEWMTQIQIMELLKDGINFVDVTDGTWNELPKMAELSRERARIYPTKSLHKPLVTSLIKAIDKSYIQSFLKKFTSFYTRYSNSSTGVQSAQFLFAELKKLGENARQRRTDVFLNVTKVKHTSWRQPSIIAKLTATKPTERSGGIVILGAHQDSISGVGGSNFSANRAPGYDDDGTGCANNLETLRLLLANPNFVPGRPIEFHFYAAEEVGLIGSQAIAAEYRVKRIPVYGMLHSDMTGYGGEKKPVYAIVTDDTNAALTRVLRFLAKEYVSIPIVDTTCGYGCSDHASWNQTGFPSSFHFESRFGSFNPQIHSANDTAQYTSFNHMVEFLKTTIAFAVELSLFKG